MRLAIDRDRCRLGARERGDSENLPAGADNNIRAAGIVEEGRTVYCDVTTSGKDLSLYGEFR